MTKSKAALLGLLSFLVVSTLAEAESTIKRCVPQNSKAKWKPGDVLCEEFKLNGQTSHEIRALIFQLDKKLSQKAKLNTSDYCHQTTDSDRAFNDCVAADPRVASQENSNLKKEVPTSEGGSMPSLDAMGNATNAQ